MLRVSPSRIVVATQSLVIRSRRPPVSKDLSFHTFNPKSQGKIKKAGLAFAAFALVWLGLIAQSGWVRYHERAGSIAFKNLKIPDELALAQNDPAQWLSPADRKTIEEGKRDYYRATDAGFFRNADAMPKLAWFEYLSGDTERAVRRLAVAAEYQQDQARALSLYYRGAILNRMGRYDEAIKDLDAALAERDDLILAREERGESLGQLGRRQEAITAWTDAVRRNPNLPVATTFLAGAGDALARPDAVALYEKQANSITPNDPYFIWMLGLRLKNLGMTDRAEKNFNRAIQLDSSFRNRRN